MKFIDRNREHTIEADAKRVRRLSVTTLLRRYGLAYYWNCEYNGIDRKHRANLRILGAEIRRRITAGGEHGVLPPTP